MPKMDSGEVALLAWCVYRGIRHLSPPPQIGTNVYSNQADKKIASAATEYQLDPFPWSSRGQRIMFPKRRIKLIVDGHLGVALEQYPHKVFYHRMKLIPPLTVSISSGNRMRNPRSLDDLLRPQTSMGA